VVNGIDKGALLNDPMAQSILFTGNSTSQTNWATSNDQNINVLRTIHLINACLGSFETKMLLGHIAETHNKKSCDDLGNSWKKMHPFHQYLQKHIIQEQTDAY
jgi:hypothetical protein